MTASPVRRPLLRAAGFGALAATLVAAACEAPQPTQPPAAGPSFAKSPLTPQTAVAHYFPEVAAKGTAPDDILQFIVSSDGDVVRHEWVRGTPDSDDGGRGLADARLRPTILQFRGNIAGSTLVRFQPGEVGPTAVQVAWTRLRPPPGARNADGIDEAHSRALHEAIRRHYPPLQRDAGVTARVTMSFTVGPDGKARGVKVMDDVSPAFAQAARDVVADLTFPPDEPGTETVMTFHFAPERRPAPDAR